MNGPFTEALTPDPSPIPRTLDPSAIHLHWEASARRVRWEKRTRIKAGVLGLAMLGALANTVWGGSLYVPNFSFESPMTPFADPRIDFWQKAPQPGTFDTNIFGAWDNLAGLFANAPATNADYIDNCNGSQLGYVFAYPQVAIFQDFNSTDWSNAAPIHAFNAKFEAGKSYRLTVGLTSSREEPLNQGSTLGLSLYYRDGASNMVVVASTNVTYDTNVFTNINHLLDFQVNVGPIHTNDAWTGQNIGIQIQSTVAPNLIGGVWDIDNVRLIETIAVPNSSFESPATPFADPRVDSWQKAPQPSTFDTNTFGAWDNLAGVFANAPPSNPDHIDNCDGNQLAYLFNYPQVALFQDFNSTDWSGGPPTHAFNAKFEIGKTYNVKIGLTSSREEPLTQGATIQLSLYYRDGASNMVTVAATSVAYNTNVFTNVTHLLDFSVTVAEVKASDVWAGQNMGIQIQSIVAPNLIGGVWDVDNVRLTEAVATGLRNPGRTNGQFSATLRSEPGLHFEILAATNQTQPVSNWTSLATLTNVTGAYLFTDTATGIKQRFYRAHQVQ